MNGLKNFYRAIGPGLMVAAAGVGAGGIIVGIKGGMVFGVGLIWAVLLTGLLKFSLNEGVARWQLITGETLLEGWVRKLPALVSILFLVFLVFWSFVTAGSLMSACGLAGYALFPHFSIAFWGILHSVLAAMLVYFGQYSLIEKITKVLMLLMFLVMLGTAFIVKPNVSTLSHSITASFSINAITLILAVVGGGVGGSVTILSYGYWLKEKNWSEKKHLGNVRVDLVIAYAFVCLFIMAIMVVAASVHVPNATGIELVLLVAEKLDAVNGKLGKSIFLFGFWGVVFSAMLSVWQGIPYLFNDFVQTFLSVHGRNCKNIVISSTVCYHFFLFFIAIPPLILLIVEDAVQNVLNYALVSSCFIAFLALTLLYMNNKLKWVAKYRNSLAYNLLLFTTLLLFLGSLFVYMGIFEK